MKRLGELSDLLGTQLFGDPNLGIHDAKTTLRASCNDITFAVSEKHLETFLSGQAPAAVVKHTMKLERYETTGKSFLLTNDVEHTFEKAVRNFRNVAARQRTGISKQAIIAASATIGDDVDILAGAVIGENVRIGSGSTVNSNVTVMDHSVIGSNTIIFPNAVIYENTIIGDRCLIHGGAVIGGFGFGYQSGESHELSSQLGNVVIGNDVEIGSNTTVDRGTYDSTVIGDGTKIDNLVMIGHNCQIGKHNLLCGQVGIAGSTSTGDYVVMGGQVGVGDHLEIGDKTQLAAQSGVMHNLAGDQVYLGTPAIPAREQMQIVAVVSKLPNMRKQLRSIQRDLDQHIGQTTAKTDSASEAA